MEANSHICTSVLFYVGEYRHWWKALYTGVPPVSLYCGILECLYGILWYTGVALWYTVVYWSASMVYCGILECLYGILWYTGVALWYTVVYWSDSILSMVHCDILECPCIILSAGH